MPQLIAIGLVGVLGLYCWKALKKEMVRVSKKVDAARDKKDSGTLEQDPETGVYRLKNDDNDT